jgi:predicted CoA-binding protein
VHRHTEDGVIDMTIPLPRDGAGTDLNGYLNAVAERERHADVASLRHVFAPESVAVIGTSRRPGTVGRVIWDNICTGGYAGRLYAVNPHARQIGGEPCLASAADLPEHVDLAVIAVPPAAVLDAAEQCGRRGVHALAVITSGWTPPPAPGRPLSWPRVAGLRQGAVGLMRPRSGTYGPAPAGCCLARSQGGPDRGNGRRT